MSTALSSSPPQLGTMGSLVFAGHSRLVGTIGHTLEPSRDEEEEAPTEDGVDGVVKRMQAQAPTHRRAISAAF